MAKIRLFDLTTGRELLAEEKQMTIANGKKENSGVRPMLGTSTATSRFLGNGD